MSTDASVTNWLSALRNGNQDMARLLWERYFEPMVGVARGKLAAKRIIARDEEDAAISAFKSFCRGLCEGEFPDLGNRDELWRLLVVITARKAVNIAVHEDRQKRGGGKAILTDENALLQILGRDPTPETTAIMNEQFANLMDRLEDENLQLLVHLKLNGFSNEECAAKLGRTRVTVQRMLRLIRAIWRNGESA